MQIILMEKITNLGELGDIVKVKNGYARNFLIPQSKAKRATAITIAEFELKRAELEKIQAETLAVAQACQVKLDGLINQITQKAGIDGKLFGSVTNVDIMNAINAKDFLVKKTMLRMPLGPIKQVGDYPFIIELDNDVLAHITVSVIGETTT